MSSRKSAPEPDTDAAVQADALADKVTAAVDAAIATDLAPAVAIALLAKAEHPEDTAATAMECLGAGVSAPDAHGKVRIQFMFDNGSVLPIEMPRSAAEALAQGLLRELGLTKS